MKTYKKGISLIVLVITVIVLAILATTVIISLSNTNIIGQASDAVNESNLATYKDQAALAYASWKMDNKTATLTDLADLEAYGFKASDLPANYVVEIKNGVPVINTASGWDGTAVATSFASGTGTATDPYIISTAEEFAYLSSYVNAGNNMEGQYIKLTSNINLNGEDWTPIGTSTNPFKGNFDGGNNTIYNLNVNLTSNHAGLFGYGYDCSLQNLTISGGEVITTAAMAGSLIGFMTGDADEGVNKTINNVTNNGVNVTAGSYAGGICGYIFWNYPYAHGELGLFSLVNYGNVKATNGFAAPFTTCSAWEKLEDSINYGKIEGNTVNVFASYQDDASVEVTITNNKNYGDIVAVDLVRFIGEDTNSSSPSYNLSNNYNYGNVTVSEGGTIDWYGIDNAPST